MVEVKAEWDLAVERGPNWLFVRAENLAADTEDERSLLECLWAAMQRHMTYRLVLELPEEQALDPLLIRQLLELAQMARAQDGCVRLCGMSFDERPRLRLSAFDCALPVYRDRQDAVFGSGRPRQPK
ncbi:MAG: STAS domain-containing protein [Planctomycetes bacterium]|nr:STAS domain-containing protein [Planctomycetota bacterium]